MKRIFKTALAIAASIFISKANAKNIEINTRVIKIRKALSEKSIEKATDEKAKNIINYFEVTHDLDNALASEKSEFSDSWTTWHNNPNWLTWTNWNNWNNWNTWHTWENWHNWQNYSWNNY